jgi:hypothetical protein
MSVVEFRDRLRLKRRRESSRRRLETDDTDGKAIYHLKRSNFQPNDENATHEDAKDTSSHFHSERVLYYSRQNDCLRTELRPCLILGRVSRNDSFCTRRVRFLLSVGIWLFRHQYIVAKYLNALYAINSIVIL